MAINYTNKFNKLNSLGGHKIAICHGKNCYSVGGKALADELKLSNISFEVIPCQSLCTYAPTAKLGHIAILNANMDKLVGE